MKHLQELGIGLKVIDFSHNHNCGGDSDWTRVNEDSRGTGELTPEGTGNKQGVTIWGQMIKGLRFTQ